MLDSGNLKDGSSRAREINELEIAIEVAIQLEKDTLLLYLNMNRTIENLGEEGIDKIIKEENYHLNRVQNLKP